MRSEGNTGQGTPLKEPPVAVAPADPEPVADEPPLVTGVLAHIVAARDMIDRSMRHEMDRHQKLEYGLDPTCRRLILDLSYAKGVLTVLIECIKDPS